MARLALRALIPLQTMLALGVLLGLALWPPRSGALLLVPLLDRDGNAVVRVALAGGATLVGRGPFPGSLVVIGSRARIAERMHGWRIALLAAPPAGCGRGPGPGAVT